MAITIPAGRSLIATLVLVFSTAQGAGELSPGHGGGPLPTALPRDAMSEAKRTEIQEQIETGMRVLRAQGKLADTRAGPIAFQWPVVASASLFDVNNCSARAAWSGLGPFAEPRR